MGTTVPLSEIGEMLYTGSPVTINRRNNRRTITVRCGTARGVESEPVRLEAREKMEARGYPADRVRLEFKGESEDRQKAFMELGHAYWVAVVLIMLILIGQFGSLAQPLVVMLTIPLSLVGVVVGLVITGTKFGFLSGVGVAALAGIVVNDALVLVDAINRLRREGMDLSEAVVEAGRLRWRPVWSTTITTIGGLVPMTIGLSGSAEFWRPLSISIIFGLLVTSILTLLVIPTFYSLVVPRTEAMGAWVMRLIQGEEPAG